MSAQVWDRLGALAGIVAVVLIAVAAAIGGSPPTLDASGDKVIEVFSDKSTEFLVGNYLIAVAMPFLLWFALALRRKLTAGEADTTFVGLAFGGAVATAVLFLVWSGILSVIALEADNNLAPDTARVLWVLSNTTGYGPVSFAAGIFAAGVSIASLRTGASPAWLGWAGALLALALLVPGLALASDANWVADVGVAVLLVFGVWVLAHSVLLLRASMRTA